MTADPNSIVRVTHRFKAARERVFDAWLDPNIAGKFLFATPTGTTVRVDIDARIGGRFAIVDRRDGEDIEHTGVYLEIDRPTRLVFAFSVPKFSALSTRVAIDIVAVDTGCELTLTHEGLLPEYIDRGKAGWAMILEKLAGCIVWSSIPSSLERVQRVIV
jgi:uncharacterized protein YndB with AHSA1/START domain